MKNNPIIQFTLILLIGFSVIIGTAWIVNHFEKTIECPNCECHCICPEQKSQIIKQKDLMDDLYFLNAVDGSVSEPTFVPFFCEIYRQCQNKK